MITPKKLHALKGWMYLAMAVVVPAILAPSSGAKVSIGFIVAAGAFFLALSGYHWLQQTRTPSDAVFYDIRNQPPEEQIRVSKLGLWALLIAGPALSLWTYHDLSSLESGAERSVRVWAPVAMLYNNFGFWPAVACWPVLCGFCAASAFFRIEKAKSVLGDKKS